MNKPNQVGRLEDVLDAFVASDVNPNEALGEWIQRYPEYEQELTEFVVSWSLMKSLPPAPDAEEVDEDTLVLRGMSIVQNLLHEQSRGSAFESVVPTVYRIHIRPGGGANNQEMSFAYCLKHGVLGMGWSVEETGKSSLSWDEYIVAAERKYGYKDVQNIRYLHREVKENDLIWTRDTMGRYYLGRVISPWEYLANEESLQADIVNFCRCEIFSVDVVDDVPGKVVASFRPSRTIQAIRNETVDIYSQLLWNDLSGTKQYSPQSPATTDIYTFLDDLDTENAVAIYLQMCGWLYLPKSRKADTMGYEYILINRETFERAVVQVKTGNTSLNRDDWSKFPAKIFLFQSYKNYTGSEYDHVECIDPDELRRFLFSNRNLLPQSIKRWVDHVATPPTL